MKVYIYKIERLSEDMLARVRLLDIMSARQNAREEESELAKSARDALSK